MKQGSSGDLAARVESAMADATGSRKMQAFMVDPTLSLLKSLAGTGATGHAETLSAWLLVKANEARVPLNRR